MTAKKTKLDTLKTATGKQPKTRKTTKSKGSTTSPKKTKLDSLSFADGKKDEKIRKAQELEELVGINEVNPYGTTITSVFEGKLTDMAIVDLQELAVTVGVFPSGTATSLRNKLKKAFRDYQRGSGSFVNPAQTSVCGGRDPNDPKFKAALELMKEGL